MGTQGPPELSRGERLALTLMLQKCTAAEIGDALNMSEHAARGLIARVTRRLARETSEQDGELAAAASGPIAIGPIVSRRTH